MKRFQLREKEGADPQSYALGIKEVRSNIKSMSLSLMIDCRFQCLFRIIFLLHMKWLHQLNVTCRSDASLVYS